MPATNAALKMAAPGELCSQVKKLMVYCKAEAKSIRAMKKHLAVTDAVVHQLLADALEKGVLRKQPNGMYKTLKDAQPANESLLALASTEHSQADTAAAETKQPQISDLIDFDKDQPAADEEVIDVDNATGQPVQESGRVVLPYSPDFSINFSYPDQAADITAELDALASLLQPEQYPVVDDIAEKQRALAGISLIIKPHAPQLVNVLDQLAGDLAVICLHQNRRA
ncbi:hypothetical protein [Arsukibacterium sp.]|uniref:hypothetical protein n=1 Tax=Arsukibacterium sp. TaxID=1977258 RepID=UPI00299E5F81|nr:hypothetical protein [Arsukibacterium sp.]MDX1538856.1 hypothetical protein [Arsukibacterium sp.]